MQGPKFYKYGRREFPVSFYSFHKTIIIYRSSHNTMPFMLDMLYEEQQANIDVPVNRPEWRRFVRGNPFESMTDREFRLNFRLSKSSVIELTRLIEPHLTVDERSHTLTPIQMVCLTLDSKGSQPDWSSATKELSAGSLTKCSTPSSPSSPTSSASPPRGRPQSQLPRSGIALHLTGSPMESMEST